MRFSSLLCPGLQRQGLLAGVLYLLSLAAHPACASTNFSVWAFPGPSGRILQQPDALGNRVLDYSGVGYKGGIVPIPTVPIKVTISPVAGDNVANIQNAINQVSALPLDTNGFRGAVLLSAGEYPLGSTIRISASGVILRGAGSGTNGTILRATATNQYTLLSITGSGSASTVSGTTHNITNNYVPVGARSFYLDSTSGLAVGDHVFVRRVATSNWIHDIGMDLLCCPPDVNPWTASGYNIDFDRVVTRIESNHLFVDAPITCAIDAHYTNGTIRKFTWSGRISNSGIEHLRGVSDYASSTDENHGWTFIRFNSIENGWARDVTSQYFGYSCVSLSSGAKFITVADCQSLDPISVITGGRRYAFVLDDCLMCLVQNCYTRLDRHQFVTQSLTTGPNVFVDGLSDSAQSDAGPHHRWGTGAIWDCVTVNGNNLNVQNRGNLGSGHGWAGANEVVWNCDADGGYVVQNPPGAHNWLIGSIGPIENGTVYVGPHDPGTYDSSGTSGTNVFPNSLYYAQLQDRLAAPNLQTYDYWLGDMDAFTNSPGGGLAPVDAAWRAAVQAAAGSEPLDGFDVVTNNHWVPLTFNFNLSANERIVGATLALSMLSASSTASNDVLYLDSISNAFTFADLGWLPISTVVTNPTVRVLDLSSQLGLLADGKLNVAVQDDVGIDWAMLELQVAPRLSAGTMTLPPVADATVRGGASANSNFGTATTLTTKEDSLADNDRKAWLRWDLSSMTGTVYQAKVRLTPVSVGTNGIEQGVTVCTNDAWTETGITWNNQPAAGKRFATWISGTNGPVEFTVTPQVLDALAGDKQLSVQLFSVRNAGAAGNVDYASREYADPSSRPQLVLLVSEAPPTISDLTNLSIGVNTSTGPIPFTVGDEKSAATDLVLSGASSSTNLVPNANIVFGGSDSNRTVTVTPAANQSGIAVITVTVTDTAGLSSSDSFSLTVSSHPPTVFVWNGPGAGANNWSSGGNWFPAGPPESLDDVKFFDPGAGSVALSNINNFLDASFGGTVASIQYGNTNGNHTTLIGPGDTLTISGAGGMTVGTETDNGNAQVVNATITGPGGALNLAGGNWIVRQATDGASGGSQRATLNMAGLDAATVAVGRLLVGSEGNFARVTGTLYLPRTNTITASGTAPAIAVGGYGGGSGNAGGLSFLYLGQTNAIFADTLVVGRGKQGSSSGAMSSIRFNPAFTNANSWLGGTVFLRAADGISRAASWNIADSGSTGGTVNTAGACDFSGGVVDAQVDTIILGKTSSGSGTGNPAGTLTLSAGTIDVNTLQLGFQSLSGNNSGLGTANVNGGTLVVNTMLELGHVSGGAGATNTAGTLSINGGTVLANSIVAGAAGGANTIAVNNGSLIVTSTAGTPAAPISKVSFTSATLQVSATTNTASLVVASLATGNGVNTLNIASLPLLPGYPAQFTLIQYSGAIGGAGYNFALGTLPAGAFCGGYLSNNTAAGSVDLVITNCTVPDSFLTWDGSVDGNWDTKTANWKNNISSGLTYADGASVVFNDAATGATNINLTATLTPGFVTVSNNLKTYAFVDLGKLSGSAGLSKQGPGALILANDDINDFTGGVTIDGGTLRVGDGGASGVLPAGSVVDNASLVFNRSDDLTAASLISGSGSVAKEGVGVLTLAGANTYSGDTMVNAGTLALTGSGSISNSGHITLASGATLDVTGRADATLTLSSGQTLQGNGTVNGSLAVGPGSTLSPGAPAGMLTTGPETWNGGGLYAWEINAVTGAAGTNWDLLQVNGGIGVQATTANPFTIRPVPAGLTGFNNNISYTWPIASATTGLANFNLAAFAIDATLFTNDLAGGFFLVSTSAASLNLAFTNNHPSVAGLATCLRLSGASLQIPIADLLAGATSDPDGDARALVSVGNSTNGASLSISNGFILYLPTNSAPDRFTYVVSDVRTNPPAVYRPGDTVRTATGTVLVLVTTDPNFKLLSIIPLGAGTNQLQFAGMANQSYLIQFATNLNHPVNWLNLLATNARPDGRLTVRDTQATNAQRFYRTTLP